MYFHLFAVSTPAPRAQKVYPGKDKIIVVEEHWH